MTGDTQSRDTECWELQQRYLEARQALDAAHRALIAAAATYPGTVHEWADATGTNVNSLGRLQGAHDLLMASRRGRRSRTLSPDEAIIIANKNPRWKVREICEEMRAGG